MVEKILVIQNKEDDLKVIDTLLSKDEYEIYYSHNRTDGLEISVRYAPALILFYLKQSDDGIEILSNLAEEEKTISIPIIVLSEKNSFSQQRKVMELGADDYLPMELIEKSLLLSIKKRLDKLCKLRASINNRINSFEEENGKIKRDDHILVKIGNKLKLLKFEEIICITALKEYSKVTTNDNCKIVVRKSMKTWIEILPPKVFLQIHRATIINIDCIEKIVKTNERTYTVHLKNLAEAFDFSHRYANIMRHTFPT